MANRFALSKGVVSKLPIPEKGRTTFYDTRVSKLAVRVTSAGARTFYVIKRADDGMAWIRLGSFPDMTVEQARVEAEKHLGAFAKGDNPAKVRREEKRKQTLGQAFDQYFKLHVIPRGVKRADDIRAIWERCLGPLEEAPRKKHGRARKKHPAGVDWSGRKLEQIEAHDVLTLHAEIGTHHKTMANRVVEVLSAVFNHSIAHGHKGTNPAGSIRPFKERKRDRFIQKDELPRFFAELANDTSIDFKHFAILALLTGVRRENLLSARWEQFDFDQKVWRIPDTKNDEPVTIPLVNETIQILRERGPKSSGYVFPSESASGHMTTPKRRWSQLLDRDELSQLAARIAATGGTLDVGDDWSLKRKLTKAREVAEAMEIDTDGVRIVDLRIHDLRRTLGSWQAITGASLVIIGKSLGHKSADATMIYSRLSVDPVRSSVGTAISAMLEAAGVKDASDVMPATKKQSAI